MIKHRYIFLIISILFFQNHNLGQNTSEIRINSVTQNGNKINVNYNIESKWYIENNATLYAKKRGSSNWEGPLSSLSGNIYKNIKRGTNNVVWNVTNDREEFTGQWVFGIDNTMTIKKNIKNLKISCGLSSLAGLAIGAYGFLKSEDYYNQYQNATLNASQLRQDATKMTTVGIAGAALGSVLFIETSILGRKIRKVKRTL